MVFNPEDAEFIGMSTNSDQANELLKYLQHQSPEVLSRVAQSVSGEIKQIIAHNVQGLVGVLPGDGFNVQVSTAMELEHTMSGSFLGLDDSDATP